MTELLPAPASPAKFLPALLDLSVSGVVCYNPLLNEAGDVIDFAFAYLNPAARRLLRLPPQPTTYRQEFPEELADQAFAFHREAWGSEEPCHFDLNYHVEGYAICLRLAARRLGGQLLVSFARFKEPDRPAIEQALRESQAREQAARAEAERQRGELLLTQRQLEASGLARTQQAQATAEHERARLARLIAEAPAAICVLGGPDFVYELVNPTYRDMFGGRPRPGMRLLAALPELASHQSWRTVCEVYKLGLTHHETAMLVPIAGADGWLEDRYFNYTLQARYDEHGHIDGVLVFAFEVTEQLHTSQQLAAALHQAEQQRGQLVEQQRLLSQILGQVPASIATLAGPEHRFTFFNEGYQALVEGRTQLGRTVAEVLPEAVEQGFIELLDRVYAAGEPFQGREMPLQLLNPSTGQSQLCYVDFIYQPLTDEQGRTLGILAFIVDVTEKLAARQHAEALQAQLLATTQRQVQEREELFQVFEQAPVVIALLRGAEHFFFYRNPAFQALFPGRVLVGRLYADAMPEIVAAGLMAQLDHVYATGLTYYGYALPVVTTPPDGAAPHLRYYDFSYQAHREDGRIAGITIFAYDVTEQMRARQRVQELNNELATINVAVQATNQELSETNAQLTRTNADLDTFVYAASHDLKAPIANIEGLLDALRYYLPADGSESMVPNLLDRMQQATSRFQQTVGHLTDISRLPQEQLIETIALADVVDGVRLDLTGLLESTHAELHLDVAGCPPLRFSVKNLRSIVFNLLSNALKYRAPDRLPVVHIRAYPTADAVLLSVQDNGLGLSAVQQSRLFAMFRRLHDHVEGSGVGLYMVKRIAENAGGTVTVQSEPGVGSTFTVSLPRVFGA